VGFGDVIERHHHQAQEQDGRDRADPVPVRGQDAVLIRCGGPTHQLQGAEIGGNETEPGNPGCHLAARQEEVFAALREALQVEADAEDRDEVDDDDGEVHGAEQDDAPAGIGGTGRHPKGERKQHG
jgi:hypothetical protein